MSEENYKRLSEVVDAFAPQGANDARWFLAEHQLAQARMSVQIALDTLRQINSRPENAEEQEIAEDCESIIHGMYTDILEHYTAFLSYISGTVVPTKISRKEL